MKKTVLFSIVIIVIAGVVYLLIGNPQSGKTNTLKITHPYNNAVFPADIAVPLITWQDSSQITGQFEVQIKSGEKSYKETIGSGRRQWKIDSDSWEEILNNSNREAIRIKIKSQNNSSISADSVQIFISEDKVEAPIFYRAVPLPFKFARENLKEVRWHIGSVSNEDKPHAVLENIPVCANCHSFSPDGKTVAMDVDARDDKGAFAISEMKEEILFAEDSIIHWSDFNKGTFTYGLLSRISPDGRYVVSTLKDCEIFVDRDDLEYSQLFFPFKGILVVYDRLKKEYFELEGANDTMLVQSNPCWSPDGEYIYFTRAKAKHYEESGIHSGSLPRDEDIPRYKKFEKNYLNRDSLIKFNIYKVPFNKGKGGKAISVAGASHNGKSNYFPKISPDGKWLVFCQAESFMLLQPDSKLYIIPAEGGEPREMTCNTSNMNSWHSWSPNSKWLIFATKERSPYTQLFLTHINDDGTDSPPVILHNFSFEKYANNIPEFVNIEYDKKMKINPTFLAENDFMVRIGEIKQKKGDLDGAFEAFDNAVKKFPDKSEPYYKRGYVHFIKNQFSMALIDFSKAIKIDDIPNYYTMRGFTHLKLNNLESVIRDLTRAMELDPKAFTPAAYLGVAYTRKNNFDMAVKSLEKAIELYDGDPLTFYYLGFSHFNLENWEDAEKAFTTAQRLGLKSDPDKPLNEMRGKALLSLGDNKRAIRDLTIAIQLSPSNQELYYLLGKTQMKEGMNNQARENLMKAAQLGSEEARELLKEKSST